MSKLHLILAFHNHQPVGNFDHVLEESYRKAYLPFLKTLEQHSSLKVVLHYSGILLAWLEKRHPEAFEMISALVRAEKVEILSGGFYEPILSAIPEKDRIPQIKALSEYIKEHFDYSPKGMWLAERVWEPQIPKYISMAGIEYVPIDDYHFRLTGLMDEDLRGYFITEEEGYMVRIFPGSERLRYLIPFKDVDEVIAYLRNVFKNSSLICMADDGEKFGVWPGTYKHCYEDGWLERFFNAIEENSDWIETTTFSEYYSKFQPVGRVYLPTASYREMGEWVGGIWRSFFAKYPESNHIHKRMLQISKKVHEAVKKLKVQKSRETPNSLLHELWKGQCNDAYWHGIFGGLYLPHLRSALYRHLLRAEYIADDILKESLRKTSKKSSILWNTVERSDYNCDGFEELSITTNDIVLSVTEQGGSLIELSLKKKAINILDILTRRPEAYHSKIVEASKKSQIPYSGEDTKTIHEQFIIKDPDITDHIVYDNYRRASLLDHFLPYGTGIDNLMRSGYEELGDFIKGVYSLKHFKEGNTVTVSLLRNGFVNNNPFNIEKILTLTAPSKLNVDYKIEGVFSGLFAVEFNISFLGSPYPFIIVDGKNLPIRSNGTHDGVKEFYLVDEFLNLRIGYNFNEVIDLWHYPVETISLSEEGVERLYQGTAFLFVKKLYLNGTHKLGFTMSFWGE